MLHTHAARTRIFLVLGLLAVVVPALTYGIEPYPFDENPREFLKTEVLKADFDAGLPAGMTTSPKSTIDETRGTGQSTAVVFRPKAPVKASTGGTSASGSASQNTILRVPINEREIGISRFDLTFDYGGEGFAYVNPKLDVFDKTHKLLRSVSFGAVWCYTGMRETETREVNLEFDDIDHVELVFEFEDKANWSRSEDAEQVAIIDNIVLRKHEAREIYGERARKEIQQSLRNEGMEVSNLEDIWIADDDKRTSFFDLAPFKENGKYVRSFWQKRTHIGTTYKTTLADYPSFILGISARQSSLDRAAAQQKKTLVQMYEIFLDDVRDHGFNTVRVDFTKELEQFDALAKKRGIYVILTDPAWSGLESWVQTPDGPIPDAFKTAAAKNYATYGRLKSLLAYQMDRPLNRNYEPMLAKARAYLRSINPKIQLATEQSDIYAAENIEEEYPEFGIQMTSNHHYIGRPYGGVSNMYHPNYWVKALTEGYYKRIYSAFEVRTMPALLEIPSGRRYDKQNISFQVDRVNPDVCSWIYDNASKKWSGWYRYKYPHKLLSALVWKALASGYTGVIIDEWGPATIAADITGSAILAGANYKPGAYEPEMLRRSDFSESDGWRELGEVAHQLEPYAKMMAATTLHGHNTARADNGNIQVRTLTGRDSPYKLIVVVNTKVGEYEEDDLKIDPDTGELAGLAPAAPETFNLTVDQDVGLIDVASGATITPTSYSTKDRRGTYEFTLQPGEGRFFFKGRAIVFRNFIRKFEIPLTTASASR